MPTLNFDDSFIDKERIILRRTFKSNCKDLGIDGRDCTVTLRRADLGAPQRIGNLVKVHEGAMAKIDEDHFLIQVNGAAWSLLHAISALGHEAVHLHQYLRGDMEDVQHKVTKQGGIRWRGKVFTEDVCTCEAMYRDLPWEQEAFGRQPDLFDTAMRALPVDELYYIKDNTDMNRPLPH
jgi:hypothetical protein